EIIKLAPVYRTLDSTAGLHPIWVSSGQHGEMADRTLAAFGLAPDLRLDPPPDSESLGVRLGHLIAAFDRAFAEAEPDIVLVQGDTSTTAAAAIAAFSRRLPIGHVEAGLRTFDLTSPFPEEAWRTVVGELTALHFAPTEGAAANLRAAG
ncbi:UDP-N-acetylglucosamine 2-epimerase, partial [Pseudomonas hunanensis]|uniref:UDP-N-acetylglucosamine 2-epimerase n=1 Tax=Pseudomonas hunanensis TaxID=1247546 RepID=UPI0030D8184C